MALSTLRSRSPPVDIDFNKEEYKVFTRSNIQRAVRNMRKTEGLGIWLGIPKMRRVKAIVSKASYQHVKLEHINFFMDHCPIASWRAIIVAMDAAGWNEEADKIRHLAEPITDTSLNLNNLYQVTSLVKDWNELWDYSSGLGIPLAVLNDVKYRGYDEKTTLLKYFIDNVPMVSWSKVAGALYWRGEEEALKEVKKFLIVTRELNLTPENLSTVLKNINARLWKSCGQCINIPESELERIRKECGKDEDCIQALIHSFLTSHPAPSWNLVAWALYRTAYDENGETCLKSLTLLQNSFINDDALYKNAMLHGFVNCGKAILILVGVTGSGKTEFKRLVLGQEVPPHSPSTPLAESAVRSMSVCKVAADGIEWVIVGPQDMLDMVGSAIKENVLVIDKTWEQPRRPVQVGKEMLASEFGHYIDTPEADYGGPYEEMNVISPEEIPQEPVNVESVAAKMDTKYTDALQKSRIDLDILSVMTKSLPTKAQQLMNVDFIYLLDSGGQPPFREMFLHFVQQASAIVLMQKLNETLNYRPTIRYRQEGGKVDEGYMSQLTNEQILHQYIQGVQSHKSKVFVVGTHKDRESECADEKREEKDKKLMEAFQPVLENQMELYDIKKLMFPVNCRSRDEVDLTVARKFRERVMAKCIEKKEKIPVPWFVLEQQLHLLAKEMEVSVLSVRECCEAAERKLLMTPYVCKAALRYLGKLNIIYYRPNILPGVVFSSAQVILDKITELVRCSHALRTSPEENQQYRKSHETSITSDVVPFVMKCGEGIRFGEYGLLHSGLLKKAFPSHYREGLFTAPDLLLLLEKMLMAGRLNSGEHFISSLLPDLPAEKIPEYRASPDQPPPLVIYYPKMWLPVGVMPSLVVYLQNECSWEPCEFGQVAHSMYHNCFQFELPKGKPGDLVLIDSVKFLEIHVRPECELDDRIFHKIKAEIMTGLSKAHESLHYTPPDVKFGFLCHGNCGNPDVHFAIPDDDAQLWRCSFRKKIWAPLLPKQKLWLEDPPNSESSVAECPQETVTNILDSGDLHTVLCELQTVTYRWKHIGLALRLDLGQLKTIEAQYRDLGDCLTEMLYLWLNHNYDTARHGEPSWEMLAAGVGHPTGGNNSALADEIIRKYTGAASHS